MKPPKPLVPATSDVAVLKQRVVDEMKEVARLKDALQWAAQTTHQAYHTHQPGTWRDCPMNLCASIRHELGMEATDGD
ncbi:hypothetical protein [Nitrolancea hollandica]|uniref:Uncharacterized protein n=1 Tax=Nitrolancea hollandica Lb TaxID=1129897 RepID=I4EG02_9BACT|nr:hypothetical protein [Nitrolancea hollandica]CCF83614.1 hypothetical protein NITHO_2510012 [Nitrolancea hollandica Lb]